MNEEAVGADFNIEQLVSAQASAWKLLNQLANEIKPGMTEIEASLIYKDLQLRSGAEKYWHPPKIRFSKNTLCAFRDPSDAEVVLQENDIYFLDLGPIYQGYEGDVGKTFTIGKSEPARKVIECCENLFFELKNKFLSEGLSGQDLYALAETRANEMGYELVGNGAEGHRISEFPHALHFRGSLKSLKRRPISNRWILEVQLRDLKNRIGAFYEDIL